MYDWNENSSSKGEYIANKTHWIEYQPEAPICGGNQVLPNSYAQGNKGRVFYTERSGMQWIANLNTVNPVIDAPAYIEEVLDYDILDAAGDYTTHYHITPVFAYTSQYGFYYQNNNHNLLDVAWFQENNYSASGRLYPSGKFGVHIKKCDLFNNETAFKNYCQAQIGTIDSTNGPTPEQSAKAIELLDTYAYTIAGGWCYVTYDSTADQNSKMYFILMHPNDTYKSYWGCNSNRNYSISTTYFTGPRTYVNENYTTGYNEYANTCKYSAVAFKFQPDESWATETATGSGQNGTWGEMGETGISSYIPTVYHPLDIRYFPTEIRQMIVDMTEFFYRSATPALEL